MNIKHSLKPIFNNNSKILILGSMPSVKSREVGFYYAHPQNRFWFILERLFNVNLNTEKEKRKFLLDNFIALWDVFESVQIQGSSDASIKNGILNNFDIILNNCNINAIFTTGKAAYNALVKNLNTNIPIIYLPSPSSANASISLETLVAKYQIILEYLKN